MVICHKALVWMRVRNRVAQPCLWCLVCIMSISIGVPVLNLHNNNNIILLSNKINEDSLV